MTKKELITEAALRILAENEGGVRYSDLVSTIAAKFPKEDPQSGIFRGAVWDLDARLPELVYKPERGLFRLIKFREEGLETFSETITSEEIDIAMIGEKEFYEPFADFLVNQLSECTIAVPLGGSKLKTKWGTPDVIGIYRSMAGDIFQKPIEVASAEIKLDSQQLITAYGQACSYKLFSHRSYLVVPASSSQIDLERLDRLCCISGIGLVLFNKEDPATPNFQIRARAFRHEPDHFHLNEVLSKVAKELGLRR